MVVLINNYFINYRSVAYEDNINIKVTLHYIKITTANYTITIITTPIYAFTDNTINSTVTAIITTNNYK